MPVKNHSYVVHLTPLTGIIASARIATFISDKLGIPSISSKEECVAAVNEGGVGPLIIVNGPPAFCKFRVELAELLRMADDWVWVQNDYTIYPPSQLNSVARARGWVNDRGHVRPPHYWSTIPEKVEQPDTYVNWNALTFYGGPDNLRGKNGKLLYYGAFRANRVDAFMEYLPNGSTISAPGRAASKFEALGKGFEVLPELKPFGEELAKYSATVLIQDKKSNERFMSLPNRFYECLSFGVAQFVAESAVDSVVRAGYKVNPSWVISSHKDVDLKNAAKIARAQLKEWGAGAKAERLKLTRTLKKAWRNLQC